MQALDRWGGRCRVERPQQAGHAAQDHGGGGVVGLEGFGGQLIDSLRKIDQGQVTRIFHAGNARLLSAISRRGMGAVQKG